MILPKLLWGVHPIGAFREDIYVQVISLHCHDHEVVEKFGIFGALTKKETMSKDTRVNRKQLVKLLNEDLSREFQAIIAYVVYSQTMKGAAFNHIAGELELHAAEELSHALLIAKQIDYLNGTPTTTPKEVKMSDKAEDMLRFDLDNERETIRNYRQRIKQADALSEFALGEVLRKIIAQEQDHLVDLADALGVDAPKIED